MAVLLGRQTTNFHPLVGAPGSNSTTLPDLLPPETAEERLGGNLILEEQSNAAQQVVLVRLDDIHNVSSEDRTAPLRLCCLQRSYVVQSH